ncbi:hypothetical protein JV33_00885 [Pectobacterium carotovorum subsp. carotovorum]|nr:hypothetical protein JV33_00885 [Pectobacterium carotovorum subsp. carotovorum]KML66764.1 hypothetical protein G032_17010 [Pectobacterium carotovorum subsp. carotovorum ICMP 5702]SHG79323.1 hypothetical protein SAMN05444147_104154 [Pectobacterium carotovorum]
MTPSFHENETTLFRLKKSIYPFKENHPPQHERKKIKIEYMKKNGLFILVTTGYPLCMKKHSLIQFLSFKKSGVFHIFIGIHPGYFRANIVTLIAKTV